MKKIITVLLCLFSTINAQLLISEVADPKDIYQARYVELHNVGSSAIDFSTQTWYIARYANTNIVPEQMQLVGSISGGSYFVIAYGETYFNSAYGYNPNLSNGSLITGNGDDTYAIYFGGDYQTGTLIDIYGEAGTDGTGEDWEYLDGFAERKATVLLPNTTWASSEWIITRPANTTDLAPLPVELTTFSASLVDNNVQLNWETATEVNNYGFEVERASTSSATETSWSKVGFVEGHGNSNSPKFYSYTDNTIEASGKYQYRLKQIDIDGTFEYSDVVEANLGTPEQFELDQNFPNPFNPITSIRFNLPMDSNVKLNVFNVLGEEVAELINENITAGYHSVNFDGSELNSGIYFYKLETNNFTQIRKMMLVK